jgi:hypothetical protein
LGKIRPREELIEQVKERANNPLSHGAVSPWRYAGVMAGIAIMLIVGTVGIRQYRRENIRTASDGTENPTQMQRTNQESLDAHPVEAALKENTVVFDGLTVWQLDECSSREQAALLSEAEEGTICYTDHITEIMQIYDGPIEGIETGTDAQDGSAVLVYRDGRWYGMLLEWSEEEIASFARSVMKD